MTTEELRRRLNDILQELHLNAATNSNPRYTLAVRMAANLIRRTFSDVLEE